LVPFTISEIKTVGEYQGVYEAANRRTFAQGLHHRRHRIGEIFGPTRQTAGRRAH